MLLSPPLDPTEKTSNNCGTATRRSKLRFKGRFRTPSNHSAPESSCTHASSFPLQSTSNPTQAHPEAAPGLSQLQGCSTVHADGKAGSIQVSTQPSNLNGGPGSPPEDLGSVMNTAAAVPTYSSALFGYVQSCLLAANDAVLLHQDLQAAARYLRRAFNIAYVRHYPLRTTVPALDLAAARVEWVRVLAPFSEAGVLETFSRFCQVQGQEGQTALKTFLQGGSGPHALHPSADLFSKAAPFSVHLAESLRLRSEDLPFWYPRAQDNQVFGHDWLWDTVRQKFVYPLLFEDDRASIMQTFVPVSRSLFLFGPAGCGKKFLAKAVAGLFDRTYAKLVAAPEAVDNAGLCAGAVANPEQPLALPPEAEKATGLGTSGSLRMIVFSLKNLPQIRNTQGAGTALTEDQTRQARQKSQEFSEAMVEAHRLLQKSADDEKWQTAERQFQVPPRRFVLLEAVELAEAVFAQFAGHVLAGAHPGKHQFPNVCLIACSNRFLPRSLLATARFDVQVFVDLPGPEKRKQVIEETVLSSLFLGQGQRGACTARRGLRKNPVFQSTTAALAACLQPSTSMMMTTAQKTAAAARRTGGAGADSPRETEIERFFVEAALQRYYSFSPAVAKVAYKRWMQNPIKQKGITHLFLAPPASRSESAGTAETGKFSTGLRPLEPLQSGERVWFAEVVRNSDDSVRQQFQEAFVVQSWKPDSAAAPEKQLVALSLVNDSLAMAKAPRTVPRVDVFTDEDRSRAVLELSQFRNTVTAFGNRSLAVRCVYLSSLFCTEVYRSMQNINAESPLAHIPADVRLLPGYFRRLKASNKDVSNVAQQQKNLETDLRVSFQTWLQRYPRVVKTGALSEKLQLLPPLKQVVSSLLLQEGSDSKKLFQDLEAITDSKFSVEFKGQQFFDLLINNGQTSAQWQKKFQLLSLLLNIQEFSFALKSYVLSQFFISGKPVPETFSAPASGLKFQREFEEVVRCRQDMFECVRSIRQAEDGASAIEKEQAQKWYGLMARAILEDPLLSLLFTLLVSQATHSSFSLPESRSDQTTESKDTERYLDILLQKDIQDREQIRTELQTRLFEARGKEEAYFDEGLSLEVQDDQTLIVSALKALEKFDGEPLPEKLVFDRQNQTSANQNRPKSFYFGDVAFAELANTSNSKTGEQKRLRKLENRIRTQVATYREVHHGLFVNELAAVVQQGVEDFLFEQLGLERDPTSGCMYYCANDVTCNECGFAPSAEDRTKFRAKVGQVAFGVDLVNLFFFRSTDSSSPANDSENATTASQSLPDLLSRIEVLVRDSLYKTKAQPSVPVGSSTQPTATDLSKVHSNAKDVLQVLHRLRNLKFSPSSSQTFLETQQMMVQEAFENTQSFLVSGLFFRVYQKVLESLELRSRRSALKPGVAASSGSSSDAETFSEHYCREFVFRTLQSKI